MENDKQKSVDMVEACNMIKMETMLMQSDCLKMDDDDGMCEKLENAISQLNFLIDVHNDLILHS